MPTYEYECSKCGTVFEAFQMMSDPPLTRCEKCGAKGTVSRLIGAGAGLIFKGSGFYETDYKRAGTGKHDGSGKSKPAESAKESSDTSKETSKPADTKPSATPSTKKS